MDSLPAQDLLACLRNKEYEGFLKIIQSQPDFLKKLSISKKEAILDMINYFEYSLYVMYILKDVTPQKNNIKYYANFLNQFNAAQILADFNSFYTITKDFIAAFVDLNLGIKMIKSLKAAIDKINQNEPGFNRLYTLYVKLCIQTKNYKAGLSIAEHHVIAINKNLSYNEEDIYNYYYYAGHIFLNLKRYDEAKYNFKLGMQTYVKGIHTAHVECRKKLLLLLLRNKNISKVLNQLNFLRTINSEDFAIINAGCEKYDAFIKDHSILNDPKSFETYVETFQKDFEKENNFGLVKELYNFQKLHILKELRQAYTQVKLEDIKKKLNLEKNTNIIHFLFEIFKLKHLGRINSKLQTLVFEKIEDSYNVNLLLKMQERMAQIREIGNEFKFEHEDIINGRIKSFFTQTNSNYIEQQRTNSLLI